MAYNETFKLLSDDPLNDEVIINISGTGELAPVIDVTDLLEFPETDLRDTSQRILVINNIGSADLTVSVVETIENEKEFRVSTPGGAVIPPTGSANYTVLFTPDLEDGLRTSKIKIENDDADIEVDARGQAIQPEGTWVSFQLQDAVPDSVMSVANGINSVIPVVKGILTLIKAILNIVKVLLFDIPSALTAIYQAIKVLVDDFLQDLQSAGIFMLPIIPNKKIIDPNVKAETEFGRFLASVGGGSEAFIQRITDSFDDAFDSKRPVFSDTAHVGALVIAVDSGNIADIVDGMIALKRIFAELEMDIDIQPPVNVSATSKTSGNSAEVTLRWGIPESVNFSIGQLFTKSKMLDIIDHFEIYRIEKQSQMYVSTASESNNSTDQEVLRRDTGEVVEPIDTVDAGNYFKQLSGALAKNSETTNQIQNLGYKFKDATVEYGQNYFYAIRSVLNDNVKSKLSNEVMASPRAAALFDVSASMNITERLPASIVKLIDVTGVERYGENVNEGKKVKPNAGTLQIQTFTLGTIDAVIDPNSLTIENATLAVRIANEGLGERDHQTTERDLLEPDEDSFKETNLADAKLKQTRLVGEDVIVTINNGLTSTIELIDRQNLGYKRGDTIRIKYYILGYVISCQKGHDDRFDKILCNTGEIQDSAAKRIDKSPNEGPCEDYNHGNVCKFHRGTYCSSVGYTFRNGVPVANNTLFEFDQCQDGSMGGEVTEKSFINDPVATRLTTTGICTGYIADKDATPSQFPDWVSIQPLQFVKIFDKFIKKMDKWVNAGLDGTQKGSTTVQEFIDLLGKKIEQLEVFIDEIQEIIDFINLVFSANAGFYLLNIPGEEGGVDRIKTIISTAEHGPDSNSNGYTAGLVFLYGGPSVGPIERLFKLFF